MGLRCLDSSLRNPALSTVLKKDDVPGVSHMHRDENKQKEQNRSVRSEHLSEVLRDLGRSCPILGSTRGRYSLHSCSVLSLAGLEKMPGSSAPSSAQQWAHTCLSPMTTMTLLGLGFCLASKSPPAPEGKPELLGSGEGTGLGVLSETMCNSSLNPQFGFSFPTP